MSATEAHGTLFPKSPRAAFTGPGELGGKVLQRSVNADAGYQPPTSYLGMFQHPQSPARLSQR